MNILSQLHSVVSINPIFQEFQSHFHHVSHPLFTKRSTSNYTDMVESVALASQRTALYSILLYLENMDTRFRESLQRKERYYVKNTRSRTILSVFGEIRYTRTIYSFKDGSKGTYCHVDEILGLPKYDRYDPCVKALVLEQYADCNSMIKVGRILGDRIYSAFSTKSERTSFAIPRQTIFNILKKAPIIDFPLQQREHTPETIYIMADETFIPLQSHNENGEAQKKMVKAAVVFEGLENIAPTKQKPRNKLTNRHLFLSGESKFWENLQSELMQLYDLDQVKNIHILGDGGGWIKSGVRELKTPETKVDFSLDKFHFMQAIARMDKDKNIIQTIKDIVVYENDKKRLNELANELMESCTSDTGIKRIQQNMEYILNHWNFIQATYHSTKMPCSMESAISHHIASNFTSVPKAYEESNLLKYLKTRQHLINGVDIRSLYIKACDVEAENNKVTLKESLDFSIFEPKNDYQTSSITSWFKDQGVLN